MTMTAKVLTLMWGKCFFRLTPKRSAKSLRKICLLTLLPLRLNFCKSYSTNTRIFDTTEMQKYLNFLSDGSSFLKNVDGVQSGVIRRVIGLLEKKKNVEEELLNLNKMPSDGDKELEYLVEEERKTYLNVIAEIKSEILDDIDALNQEEDNRNVEIQIIPGIGGSEAVLFGQELFSMYLKYINFKKWELKEVDQKSGSILVSGNSVYNHFKHEAGVHRVQRVPETEKQGRTHTSTCSVAVLPQPKPHEVVIRPKDIITDRMRSSAPGGQNVNKTESCIRLTHIPTGVVVECQTSRFQYENKSLALEKLKRILFNMENEKACSETKSLRKKQIGSNDYSDKIRTYHYSQNRVTDHRINYTISNVRGFLSGTKELDEMIHKVSEFNKENELLFFVEKILQSAEYKNFEKHATQIQHSK